MKQVTTTAPEHSRASARKAEISAYIKAGVAEQKSLPKLVFGLDATASRGPTWALASDLTADMFREVAAVGGLSLQLVYYRGLDECRSSKWFTSAPALTEAMRRITCRAGGTQLCRVLKHVINQPSLHAIRALVFIGDCYEESLDAIPALASALRDRGVPAFMFQEGSDETASIAFKRIAELSGGVHAKFNAGAAAELARLLRAAARYAAAPNKSEALTELRNVAGLIVRY